MKYLTHDELKKQVPSVFSTQSHENTSGKYKVIPTIECIEALENSGFYPVKASQTKSRSPDKLAFSKHMIRFRYGDGYEKGDNVPEIVMTNSHDGLSSYQLRAGIYRMVCSNGLIVGNDLFCHRVCHKGEVINRVVDSAKEIVKSIPYVMDIAKKWEEIDMTDQAKLIYAESASLIKWDEENNHVRPQALLTPLRNADSKSNLWTTFNLVQEKFIRGGVRYYNAKSHTRGRTREVNSVNETSRINIALWNLTEKMAEILTK